MVGGGFCVLGGAPKDEAVEREILQDDNPVLQDDKGDDNAVLQDDKSDGKAVASG
jgi:hypothetical protein